MAVAPNNGHRWLMVGIPLLAAIAAVLGFMYAIGQRTSKITEVVDWKDQTAPRIERMDSQGTVSFTLFHTQYDKEQGQQYERIKELEKKAEQIEVLKSRIDAVERNQRIDKSN